jgi:hypothetical protein
VVAPVGTGTLIEVFAHVVGVPGVPLNVTVLVPWLVPKLVPLIVTDTPTAPEVGVRLVILGVAAAEMPAQKMTWRSASRRVRTKGRMKLSFASRL